MRLKWTKHEDDILQTFYKKVNNELSINDIMNLLPNRSWIAIKSRAALLNVKILYRTQKAHNVEILLNESYESYYWMGFIMADGHIANNIRLTITLAIKDRNHLLKLGKYINFNNIKSYENREYPNVSLNIQDPNVIPKICEKFDIRSNKTMFPANLNFLDGDNFLSFFAGFIDGDGSIKNVYKRTDAFLRIKCHKAWLNNFKFFEKKLYSTLNIKSRFNKTITKINNSGYAQLNITDNTILRALKYQLLSLNIPLMSRKWDVILEHKISKYEQAKFNRINIIKLKNKGLRNTDISSILKLSEATISNVVNRRYK